MSEDKSKRLSFLCKKCGGMLDEEDNCAECLRKDLIKTAKYRKDKMVKFSQQQDTIEQLTKEKSAKDEVISDYISGTCRCPHSKGSSSHFPGCPKINAEKVEQLTKERDALVKGVHAAKMFISNGIDLGFIRMPDQDTPDSAHKTLPLLESLLAKHKGE